MSILQTAGVEMKSDQGPIDPTSVGTHANKMSELAGSRDWKTTGSRKLF
jgi:hypothetical protein